MNTLPLERLKLAFPELNRINLKTAPEDMVWSIPTKDMTIGLLKFPVLTERLYKSKATWEKLFYIFLITGNILQPVAQTHVFPEKDNPEIVYEKIGPTIEQSLRTAETTLEDVSLIVEVLNTTFCTRIAIWWFRENNWAKEVEIAYKYLEETKLTAARNQINDTRNAFGDSPELVRLHTICDRIEFLGR